MEYSSSIQYIVGAVVGIVYGLCELIKFLLGKLLKKSEEGKSILTPTEKETLYHIKTKVDHLDEMHTKFDEDGIPLWYIPRSWFEHIKENSNHVSAMTATQEATYIVLEKMVKVLEKMDRNQERQIGFMQGQEKQHGSD